MCKNLNIEVAKRNIELLNKHGIHSHGLFIIGWPGETEETIGETADLISCLKLSSFSNLPGLMVLPGTAIYNKLVNQKWINDDFWLTKAAPPFYTGEHSQEQLNYFSNKLRLDSTPKSVLIASVVNQDLDTFKHYLDGLSNMEIPKNTVVQKCFILHNCPELKALLKPGEYLEATNSLTHDSSHTWTIEKFDFISRMKNKIIEIAKLTQTTHIFWVDSDIIVDPKTLKTLLMHNVDIVGELFLTKWPGANQEMPNAWHADQYSFFNDPNSFKTPGVYEVGGTGALCLVKTDVYNERVHYTPIPNVTFSVWEDRAFCIRAMVDNRKIYLDTQYPAQHLYTEELKTNYKKMI
jgi:hypothetical protein